MMLDCRMLSQGPSTENPPKCRMPSTPSQIASTCARSERSAALNFSSLPRSAGGFRSESSRSGKIGGSNLRKDVPIPPAAPVINMRGISFLFSSPSRLADLRSPVGSDSKPPREETTTRTANDRCISCGWLASGNLLSRPCDPGARPAFREILAETVSSRTTGDGAALGGRPGLGRRRPLPALQRHPEPAQPKVEREARRGKLQRKPSNFANGNTRDRQGRLVTCEH